MDSNAPRIYLSPPYLSGNEWNYLQEALRSNWIAPVGPFIERFEKEVCQVTNIQYSVALNSGTAAIHLGLQLLGVGVGDEVICPTLTFVATANPILYLGAKPIFVDSEPDTFNISPDNLRICLKDRLKQGKKPAAVIVVHLYGMPAKMDEIVSICAEYQVPILEDSAESLGALYNNQATGTFGKMGIYSFNGNKITTTSGGGMLVSNEPELINKACFLATQARDQASHYQHSAMGYNYRMSNLLAAIGCAQLEQLQGFIQKRRHIFETYHHQLANVNGFSFIQEAPNCFSTRWLTVLQIEPQLADTERVKLQTLLETHNIESRPVWKPLHLQPLFAGCEYYGEDIAERFFNRGLCLPSGSSLTDSDLERIITLIKESL